MKKKKIIFLAPRKGGAYNYYAGISKYLTKKYSDIYDIHITSSILDYIKLHFKKTDILFSIIPFLWRPLGAKKYVFNPHGDFKSERKNMGIGIKLLYFSEKNLRFTDTIMLSSYYLADKLNFRKLYDNKIFIAPNYHNHSSITEIGNKENKLDFLTITSFDFYDKGKGVLELLQVINSLCQKMIDEEITFTIVGDKRGRFFQRIHKQSQEIELSKNLKLHWAGYIEPTELVSLYKNTTFFLYRTEQDNYPLVILDAIAMGLKVFVNNYESFPYFLGDDMICDSIEDMLRKIEKNITTPKNRKHKILGVGDVSERIYQNLILQ